MVVLRFGVRERVEDGALTSGPLVGSAPVDRCPVQKPATTVRIRLAEQRRALRQRRRPRSRAVCADAGRDDAVGGGVCGAGRWGVVVRVVAAWTRGEVSSVCRRALAVSVKRRQA